MYIQEIRREGKVLEKCEKVYGQFPSGFAGYPARGVVK